MGEVADPPDGRFMSEFADGCVVAFAVVGSQVENVEFGFEGCCDEFVHGDVASVELNAADAVFEVFVPAEAVHSKVEEFDIAVVVSSCEAAFFTVVGVAEFYCPAVRLDFFILAGFE